MAKCATLQGIKSTFLQKMAVVAVVAVVSVTWLLAL